MHEEQEWDYPGGLAIKSYQRQGPVLNHSGCVREAGHEVSGPDITTAAAERNTSGAWIFIFMSRGQRDARNAASVTHAFGMEAQGLLQVGIMQLDGGGGAGV